MIDFDALVVGPCMVAFGEPVLFQPQQGYPVMITAVFDDKHIVTSFRDGDEVQDTKTILGCQASQFPGLQPQQGDIFVIRGRLWRVRDALPDGLGHIEVDISLANDMQANLPAIPPTFT